jgi:uncharacterized protein YycO
VKEEGSAMITRSTKNKNNDNKIAIASRGLLLTAVAAAMLNSVAYAQTNSSSGINRQSAQEAAKSPTTATVPTKAKAKQVAKRAPVKKAATPKTVKITIRGNRNDVRDARREGMQSLQNANAAVAARNAEREAAAAANAEAAAANAQAVANAQNNFNSPYNYGFVPGNGTNPIASYGYGNGYYGSASTAQPVIFGATPYGSSNLTFPSYYNSYNYGPGVVSTYSGGSSVLGPISYYGY